MSSSKGQAIEFVVSGRPVEQGAPASRSANGQFGTSVGVNGSIESLRSWAGISGTVKRLIEIDGTTRGADAQPVRVSAQPGEDVVILGLEDGPTLVLHPEHARDLLRSQAGSTTRSSGAVGAIVVPASLGWPAAQGQAEAGISRGLAGRVLIKVLAVLAPKLVDKATQASAAGIQALVDGRVEEGVYRLGQQMPESLRDGDDRTASRPLKEEELANPDGKAALVLIHGTFVDTPSTFGKLWRGHPSVVNRLFSNYGQHGIFALDHATVGSSPIDNALTLLKACAPKTELHLLTHSRGGLVAEVVARACAAAQAHGEAMTAEALADADLDLFEAPDESTSVPDSKAMLAQRSALAECYRLARERRIVVTRVVRVACPSRGTLLASERLDAALSVFRWVLERAGLPVVPELLGFLGEVARRRMRPSELPGLEAMMPDSALIQWIHACSNPIPGELRVLAGDLEGDSLASWVKTLVSDSFFWTDNDLIVQTRSMYGGGMRQVAATSDGENAASFVLERGGRISHFSYFSEATTVDAIASALLEQRPSRFATIGPLSARGESATGKRAAGTPTVHDPAKPAVFVLPGILGSHVACNGKRVWCAPPFINGLAKLAWSESTDPDFKAQQPLWIYDELIDFLGSSHEVIPFPFDWRRPIEAEAARLAQALDEAMNARERSGAPVRLLAHSMGGLVARAVELQQPATWQRLMARDGSRLVMLGTPNGGSWAPMQLLTGDDDFGNTIAAVGSLFDDGKARRIIAGMPGLISMQAGFDEPDLKLDRREHWQQLAEEDHARLRQTSVWHDGMTRLPLYQWSGPEQPILDRAVSFRRKLDATLASLRADRFAMVLGAATWTPARYVLGLDGLEYEMRRDAGDGRVLDDSALLPGVPAWRADVAHSDLATARRHFSAYEELLSEGTTARLPGVAVAPRAKDARRGGAPSADAGHWADRGGRRGPGAPEGAAAQADGRTIRVRPSRQRSSLPPPGRILQGIDTSVPLADASSRDDSDQLNIAVVHGDLRFADAPLLIGHYDGFQLAGAEATIDALLGGSLGKALHVRLYPDVPGTHRVFANFRTNPDNPWDRPRPPWVVVVGLGAEGLIQPAQLTHSVRQAVVGLSQRIVETSAREGKGPPRHFDLCTTLMGSGITGISAVQSGQLIAQGVFEANAILKRESVGWPWARQLKIIELYLDRAAETWRTLRLLGNSQPRRYAVDSWLQQGDGGLRRPADTGSRTARYDTISAVSCGEKNPGAIDYTIDSRRARTELRAQMTQGRLVEQLVGNAWGSADKELDVGRSLFKLLVPFEVEPWFGGEGSVVLELDSTTAAIPWELLDADDDEPGESGENKPPWAIRTRLVRRLRTPDFRAITIDSSTDDSALVLGDPDCDRTVYPFLPGAREEARAVAEVLAERGGSAGSPMRVHALIPDDDSRVGPNQVINALLAENYRVIHIAAHGEPNLPPDPVTGKGGQARGVVLKGDVYVGANEVKAMRKVPELVFLNCCYLGRFSAEQLAQGARQGPPMLDNRPAFAAGVADELIRAGVRCVIAAGWPIDDAAAKEFATTFYEHLFGGSPFIDAVHAARGKAWDRDRRGTTWAAYQCYGDPDWRWRGGNNDGDTVERGSGVASAVGLTMELEQLTTVVRYGGDPQGRIAQRLRLLRDRFEGRWGNEGQVAEAFASVYAALGDIREALKWYGRAMAAPDGSSTLRAMLAHCTALVDQPIPFEAHDEFSRQLDSQIQQLEGLDSISGTAERAELLGRACRQRARLESARRKRGRDAGLKPSEAEPVTPECCPRATVWAESTQAECAALEKARERFGHAVERHLKEENPGLRLWPAMDQVMVATRCLLIQRSDATDADLARLDPVEVLLAERNAQRPDFRSKAAEPLLRLARAINSNGLDPCVGEIGEAYRSLHEQVSAPERWRAVLDDVAFILEPWRDMTQRKLERRAAQALLTRLRNYAGLGDEVLREPESKPTPATRGSDAGEGDTPPPDGPLPGVPSSLSSPDNGSRTAAPASARPGVAPATPSGATARPSGPAEQSPKPKRSVASLNSDEALETARKGEDLRANGPGKAKAKAKAGKPAPASVQAKVGGRGKNAGRTNPPKRRGVSGTISPRTTRR